MINPIKNERRVDGPYKAGGLFMRGDDFSSSILLNKKGAQIANIAFAAGVEHTQAQNQELREAAGDLLAQLKSCGAESEKIANLAAALSNNPQVSEPCPTCGGKGTVPSGVNPVVTVDCPECRPVVQVSEGSEAAGWQPIETAPKGNADLLLLCGSAGVGYWDKHMQKFRDHYGETCSPTHWMAIPESPATTSNPIPEGEGERDA